jgi:hypothetical protein
VYGLYRPDGRICYVGKGRAHRPMQHFKCPSKHRNKHLGRIIIAAGGTLRIEWLVSGLSERAALAEEIRLIAEIGRSPNGPLVNLTDGGDGVSGLVHSVETRARLSALVAGTKQTPERIEKRTAKLRGRKMPPRTPEWCAAHSAALRGKKLTAEHRAKLTAVRLGRTVSEATKEKIGKAHRGRTPTTETRLHMSASHIGKKQSRENIEKRIAPLRGRKRDPSIMDRVLATKRRLAHIANDDVRQTCLL